MPLEPPDVCCMYHFSISPRRARPPCKNLAHFFWVTHTNSWQPPSTTSSRCWRVFYCWLRLLFGEERCCSFIFRVALGHEPYCYCWQKSFYIGVNFPGKKCLVLNTASFTQHSKFYAFRSQRNGLTSGLPFDYAVKKTTKKKSSAAEVLGSDLTVCRRKRLRLRGCREIKAKSP